MVRCPRCGSKRVSSSGSKWKCDMCRCEFTASSNLNFGDNIDFEEIRRKREERIRREREEKERAERAKKDREERIKREERIRQERERQERERRERQKRERERRERQKRERERRERAKRETERKVRERQERERRERERRERAKRETERREREIREMAKRDKEKRERQERERKRIEREKQEYNESVWILKECDYKVLEHLSLSHLPLDIESRDKRIDLLAKKFNSADLKVEIAKVEEELDAQANTNKFELIVLIIIAAIFIIGLIISGNQI